MRIVCLSSLFPVSCVSWTAFVSLGLAAVGLAAPVAGADKPPAPTPPLKTYEVETVRDIAYYSGPDADKVKHKLDLYLPKGKKDFPVLLFVHGGAWRHGDKNYLGIYSSFGTLFARHGIGTVVTNYRLSPGVQHPEHEKDVARAFAWTYRNIAPYGGRPDEIFVSGHSAGGHLVALLATDPTYLKAEGLTLKAIRGAIPMSGVYTIADGFLPSVFGKDSAVRKDAGPINHCAPGDPPFLILYAEHDLPTLGQMARDFARALEEQKCEVAIQEIKKRNHISLILDASVEGDPASTAILNFIAAHAAPPGASAAK
jgi:acetyl esterase/lipase